jgi:ATP-dependent DNA helicase RecG
MKTAQKLAQGAAAAISAASAQKATVDDLIHYLPMRYEDRSNLARIRDLQNGMWATIEVEVRVAGTYPVKCGKLRIFEIYGTDGTGQVRAFWWNQGYLQTTFKQGRRVLLYGQWKRSKQGSLKLRIPTTSLSSMMMTQTRSTIMGGVPIYRKFGDLRTRNSPDHNHVLARLDLQIEELS